MGAPKCPRCGAAVAGTADELGFLSCGGCGARLRKAPAVKLTIQSPTQTTTQAPVAAAAAPPPTPTGNRDSTDSLLARIERVDASATLPPGLQSNKAIQAAGYSTTPPPAGSTKNSDALDGLKGILQAIQKDMATLKQSHQDLAAVVARLDAPKSAATASGSVPAPTGGVSSGRPKSATSSLRPMIIVDDDKARAEELKAACEKLGFAPLVVDVVRTALDAMGRERPAVLVLEPLLTGELSGKDFVNYVKSTMEWIEIPILLHTRAEIVNHEQARTDYGADDYVIKGDGSVDLVARKIVRLTS